MLSFNQVTEDGIVGTDYLFYTIMQHLTSSRFSGVSLDKMVSASHQFSKDVIMVIEFRCSRFSLEIRNDKSELGNVMNKYLFDYTISQDSFDFKLISATSTAVHTVNDLMESRLTLYSNFKVNYVIDQGKWVFTDELDQKICSSMQDSSVSMHGNMIRKVLNCFRSSYERAVAQGKDTFAVKYSTDELSDNIIHYNEYFEFSKIATVTFANHHTRGNHGYIPRTMAVKCGDDEHYLELVITPASFMFSIKRGKCPSAFMTI